MILMDIRLDNIYSFKNFWMNMSYPRKVSTSTIPNEHLPNHSNFRYKKVNIIMGANASGKTSLGKALMHGFNLIARGDRVGFVDAIADSAEKAHFGVDIVFDASVLYRIDIVAYPVEEGNPLLRASIQQTAIGQNDSYEKCAARFDDYEKTLSSIDHEELERIPQLSWLFGFALADEYGASTRVSPKHERILELVLKALDPAIEGVKKLNEVEDAYYITTKLGQTIIIEDGELLKPERLSAGTREGLNVANFISSIKGRRNAFYYSDEQFSLIHSDLEKAMLGVMVASLGDGDQLFFTTHNTDVLDLNLPKHSFTFLNKDIDDDFTPIQSINASSLLKRNTDSLRMAVENDLFSTAPSLEYIYQIESL